MNMKKIFELHQKITLMVNEYKVLSDSDLGVQQTEGYVKQKRFALREKFDLFKDETQKVVVASSQARSVMDFGAIYDIKDSKGKSLAAIKKDFRKSLLRSTWEIYDPEVKHVLFTLSEKSKPIAISRRLWELAPFASDFPFPIKYHFLIKDGSSEKIVGEYSKITRYRDHYALHLEESAEKKLPAPAWMIVAVLLDAMQSR